MGVYDYLKGSCPVCGDEIGEGCGDAQVKWFNRVPNPEDCFRTFRPGDELPVHLPDGEYLVDDQWACSCWSEKPLIAIVTGGIFDGFTRDPAGHVADINFSRRAMEKLAQELFQQHPNED